MLFNVIYLTTANRCNGFSCPYRPWLGQAETSSKTIAEIVYITNILGVCFECAGYASLVYPLSSFMKGKLETPPSTVLYIASEQ